tara:strand:+ start:4400 stop:4900 length:501 start_codon:yes stop_codon:yes gene_type:complete
MAYSTIPKVKKDGTIILTDGSANSLTVAYEEGNFSFDFPLEDAIVIRDRGTISCVRKGDNQPITGTFSFYFRDFTDSEVGGVRDFITKQNAYSANTSTGTAGSPYVEHYCISIKYEIDSSLDGHSSTNSAATLAKCTCSFSFSEGDPSAFSISFTAYGGVTYTQAS